MATATDNKKTEVANSKPGGKLTLRQNLEGNDFKASIATVLPKHMTPDRMVRSAIMAMTRQPKLKDCDQASFFLAMMNLSLYGLEPDGRRAHLIPFVNRSKKIIECQLVIDYKGLAELVMRSGVVSNIHADLVCENDVFEYDRGELRSHRIDFRKPRGAVYAVYCLIRMKDGSEKCEVMSSEDVNDIRDKSQGYKAAIKYNNQDHPWIAYWSEMAKKTVFRRLSKWMPLSPEIRDAADLDDEDKVIDSTAKPIAAVSSLGDLTDRLIGGYVTDESTQGDDDEAGQANTVEGTPNKLPSVDVDAYEAAMRAATSLTEVNTIYERTFGPDAAFDYTEEQANEAVGVRNFCRDKLKTAKSK